MGREGKRFISSRVRSVKTRERERGRKTVRDRGRRGSQPRERERAIQSESQRETACCLLTVLTA